MDPRLKNLADRTNLDELLRPAAPDVDLNQPVETSAPGETEPMRSTYDPLQVNFATADMAGRLHNSRTSRRVKMFALVFLGGPLTIFGLEFIFMAFASPNASAAGRLLGFLFGLAMAGFWPWIIFGNRRRKASQD